MSVVLVTGATRGIGREVARRLVDAGHTVYVGARDPGRGEAVAAELGALPLAVDVTDDASVEAAVGTLLEREGRLDVLVNNAGIAGEQRPPVEQSAADLERVLATNVVGATRVLTACTPLLEASDAPVVVNVSSAVGSLGRNAAGGHLSLLAYPMSKAALNMLTVQYARAFPRWRVNSVTPGLTATEFSDYPGGKTVEEGAEPVVRAATPGPDGPTGTFVDADGVVPW